MKIKHLIIYAGMMLAIAGCKKDNNVTTTPPTNTGGNGKDTTTTKPPKAYLITENIRKRH